MPTKVLGVNNTGGGVDVAKRKRIARGSISEADFAQTKKIKSDKKRSLSVVDEDVFHMVEVKKKLPEVKAPAKPSKVPKATRSRPDLVVPAPLPLLNVEVCREELISPVPLPPGVVCIDDEKHTTEFSWPETMAYLRQREGQWQFPAAVLISSNEYLMDNRSVIMAWILEVALHYRLSQECLYHVVAIFDSTLAKRSVESKQLQLLAITSVLIASKLEEYHPPSIDSLVSLTQDSYTTSEVIKMEMKLLSVQEFRVVIADPAVFLHRFIRAAFKEIDPVFRHTAFLFYDSYLMCLDYSEIVASKKCAAAVYAARHVQSEVALTTAVERWPPTLQHYTQYTEADVLPLACKMIRIVVDLIIAESKKPHKSSGLLKKYRSTTRHLALVKRNEFRLEHLQKIVSALNDVKQTTNAKK